MPTSELLHAVCCGQMLRETYAVRALCPLPLPVGCRFQEALAEALDEAEEQMRVAAAQAG